MYYITNTQQKSKRTKSVKNINKAIFCINILNINTELSLSFKITNWCNLRCAHCCEYSGPTESAKTVCAAYVFLLNLRKTNKELYLQLYTKRQDYLSYILYSL